MAGKRKKGGKKKGRRKRIDELELRRNLREQALRRDLEEMESEMAVLKQELLQYPDEIRLGGVEGGATHSTLVIIDSKGTPLTEVKGPNTNHWSIGMDETAARINAMVQRGKEALNMPETVPLHCLGLSLSGCEEEKTNQLLVETMQTNYPNVAKYYVVSSDTLGSLRTALDNGGIVLIAGTGSNGLMIGSDGKVTTCGGWGHLMGDEGSAYWIAHRACKYIFDDIDGLFQAPEPIGYVWPALRTFFNVSDRQEMLPYIYTNFEKSKFAGFAKAVADGCENKDPLCLHILRENGVLLAKHIVALARKADNNIKLTKGGLNVVCVGSVWKSWEFMKDAFLEEIHDSHAVDELSLLRLTASSAIGACYLAAERIDWTFTKPYENNVEMFYHYKRENYVKPTIKVESKVQLVKCK
ncbi:N-acetylglucosamine kinase isoform X1 [Colletes latitarsis]|uniref:N-acetylglucosamine kinase isoform X1 n=2 Tax=Colletes latitarsis TaxID=2605962 RepID=UPI004034FB17